MKPRIPARFHGLLCLIGFALLMSIPAIAEWIGGLL